MASKKKKLPRQHWRPNWFLSLLYGVWRAAFAIFKIAIGAAATVLLIGVICGFVFVDTLGDFLQDDILPMADMDMEGYDYEQNSYLYYVDSEGQIQEYQRVFAETSSQWADYEDIPKNLINAAIAIEDHRFNEHQGVDWITTVKATARMFFGDSSVGGSSITQQLIKNILLKEDDSADDITVQRKVLEIFRAIQLEKRYDKETIMEMYLNVIYLGQGCRGVRSAAATYFGKELEVLSLAECASLISITNNPSLFDPYSDNTFKYKGEEMDGMQRNRYRQILVLDEMLKYDFITQEEYDEAIEQEIVLKNGIAFEDKLTRCPNSECGNEELVHNLLVDSSKYYCTQCNTEVPVEKSVSQDTYSWFTDTVLKDVAKDLAEKNGMAWNDNTWRLLRQQIQRGGYHIYTTLDIDVQNQVDVIYTDLTQIPKPRSGQQLQSAMIIIDNRSGDIVAMAGGVGEKTGYYDHNRATDSKLQTGSSIKPLAVYAPAFELGTITPATVIKDLPNNYDNGTAYPLNDNRKYTYAKTIFEGVTASVNAIAANTLDMIGINYSFNFAKEKFSLSGLVESYVDSSGRSHTDKDMGPLALGAQTFGVSVRDITAAFATFANEGVYREARTYTKVYDSDGNLILDNTQEQTELLSEKTVDYMNYCLTYAVTDGTGYEGKLKGISTAAKTGTTGNSKDRWFCGFTGYYTASVWCGFDTPEVIRGISGNPSAQLFKKVMQPIHNGKSDIKLYDTRAMKEIEICLDSGKLATEACKNDVRVGLVDEFTRIAKVRVYEEDKIEDECDKHIEVDYCTEGKAVANQYCHLFAAAYAENPGTVPGLTPATPEDPENQGLIVKKSLVKMLPTQIEELVKAKKYNLLPAYLMDDYVYLVNDRGEPINFTGFEENINLEEKAPYKVCTVHTQQAWEIYQEQLQQATEPSDPSEPSDPTDVTEPDVPDMPPVDAAPDA